MQQSFSLVPFPRVGRSGPKPEESEAGAVEAEPEAKKRPSSAVSFPAIRFGKRAPEMDAGWAGI